MNPSAWSNPPPPGLDMDEESKQSTVSSRSLTSSIIDQIDPYIKNPEYIKYKKSLSRDRGHRRSRSRSQERFRSRSRERRRRRRSRSRRRSGSRSRGHRRRYSSSRSRSSSYERRSRHKRKRSRRSRSRSRGSRYKCEKRKENRRSASPYSPSNMNDSFENDPEQEEDDEQDPSKENAFKNDGSFLEMFKKMQEEKEQAENAVKAGTSSEQPKKVLPLIGKRRGGRVLKTGMVEKTKNSDEDELAKAQDPWSIYLKEVKKYKEACCDDDLKTRPLIK